MSSEARIDVVIGSAEAQAGANAIVHAINQVKTGFLDLSAKAFATQMALDQVWRVAKRGAEFEETMGRLDRQMGNFHSRAQVMVTDLQNISQQTLSIDQAASMASRALAVGLNPDQIRTFTEAADALDEVMGTDLPTAFDQIVQAAITGRSQILANIGVYVDLDEEVKKLAVSTGRTTDQITKQEKAMLTAQAITAQAGDALKKLSDGTVSDAKRLEQVEARWRSLWLTIGQGAKSAAIEALDAFAALKTIIEDNNPFKRAAEIAARLQAGAPTNPATQEIFGRAIVQDAQGKLGKAPIGSHELRKGLPTSLQGQQLESERDRRSQELNNERDRTKIHFDSMGRLYDLDAQRQMVTREDVVKMKGDLRLREITSEAETLTRQLELEKVFHDRRVKIGFDSTEERIEEDERFKSKVFEVNEAIRKSVADYSAASQEIEAERELARMDAESKLGQRLADDAKSQYEIREAMRQRDFDATQTYYQGEIDMAEARFASDEEIAQEERQLLREQMAFQLRISTEQADRLLFLRKAGDFQGVDQILAVSDPTIPKRAREGMVESFTAKDIRAAERANGDLFAGWQRGMQDYMQRADVGFNFASDQARRAAHGMEQGFQTFFFDVFEGKMKSFQDVLGGVLTFTKQIIAQMAAQMATVGILKGLGSMSLPDTGWLNNIGEAFGANYAYNRFGGVVPIEHFAAGGVGGITHRPQHMALGRTIAEFGEGPQAEAFVPLPDGRTIPVTLQYAGARPTGSALPVQSGPVSNIVNVTVHTQAGSTQSSNAGAGPNLSQLARDLGKLVEAKLIDEQRPGGLLARMGG